jgi:serine/threonine protein kinase
MSHDEPSIGIGVDASASEDAEVGRVLDEYLAVLEAGRPADPGRLLAEHPAIASQLRACLEVMHLAGRVAEFSGSSPVGEDEVPLGPQLADYRIIRQIGRGGMGIVYEAEQQSLRRRVALKVLPLAAAIDPRQLRRFQVEAQAAAQLHHTHIVPVYAVGCERGVHYYAMQYIEGKTLAQLIRELRQLEGREAAEEVPTIVLGGDLELASMLASGQLAPAEKSPAADAPASRPTSVSPPATRAIHSPSSSTRTSAYFRTVANLSIQAAEALEHAHQEGVIHRDIKPANVMVDVKGHLWITDFGLARLQNDSGLTLSGDLVGTIRYMSPEQAIGQRAVVDQRTDIYALGVTLYELVALEPAFDGQDRREVLRRIVEDEPRPLRALNPSAPRELETIIQKATAKEPETRYTTAQDLADDLRRFLEHKPIQARRPTLFEAMAKWARRHTAAVITATITLAVATAGLAIDYIRVAREQARTSAALARAESRTQLARQAVDEMYSEVAQKWLENQPGRSQLQRDFLEKALAFYQEFSRERGDDPQVRRLAAEAYSRVGSIQTALGRDAEAEVAHRGALHLRIRLADENPANPDDVFGLAGSLSAVAVSAATRGDRRESEDLFRRQLAVLERWVAEHPDRARDRRSLALGYMNLGTMLKEQGQVQQAEPLYRRAIDVLEQSRSIAPLGPGSRQHLARIYFNLGSLCYEAPGRRKEALAFYRRALSLREGLATEFPDRADYRADSADARMAICNTSQLLGDRSEAEAEGRRALDAWKGLVRDFSEHVGYRFKLANAYSLLGQNQFAVNELEGLVSRSPSRHEFRSELGLQLANHARGLLDQREPEKALPILQRSRSLIRSALEASPRSPAYLRYLSVSCRDLAETLLHLGRYADAAQVAEELAAVVPDGNDAADAAAFLIRCALQAREDGRLSPAEREAKAGSYTKRARALIRESERLGADEPEAQASLASLLAQSPDPHFRDPARALELIGKAFEKLPRDDRYWGLLGAARYRTGDAAGAIQAIDRRMEMSSGGDGSDWFYYVMALGRKGDREQARTWFGKAASWTDRTRPKDDLLRRLRAEAASLLGLGDAPLVVKDAK